MEKYVCNLELAKKLKELGAKQESEFWWVGLLTDIEGKWCGHIIRKKEGFDLNMRYSAFLSDELLEMLPGEIEFENSYCILTIEKGIRYKVFYTSLGSGECVKKELKLPNALAKMLIYLIEQKILDPKHPKL